MRRGQASTVTRGKLHTRLAVWSPLSFVDQLFLGPTNVNYSRSDHYQRGGRKQILSPPGATPWSPAPRVDSALVKAVVRAHRWRHMLESGEYSSSAELAKAEKVNDSYLSRILRLTLIAPDIIEAILSGRQASTLQLDDLLKPLPAAWERQRSELGVQQ